MEMIPQEIIEKRIFVIRGYKVMIDRELAKLVFPASQDSYRIYYSIDPVLARVYIPGPVVQLVLNSHILSPIIFCSRLMARLSGPLKTCRYRIIGMPAPPPPPISSQ